MSFKIYGFIYGPEMPEKKVKLPNGLQIYRVSRQIALQKYKEDTLKIDDINLSGYGYVFLQKKLKIFCDYHFIIRVNGENESEAINKGEDILKQSLFILSIKHNRSRYMGKIAFIEYKGKGKGNWTSPTQISTILSKRKKDVYFKYFDKYYKYINDKIIIKSMYQLNKTWDMMFQNDHNVLDIPILLSYFKIIETIANEVSKVGRIQEKFDIKKLQVIAIKEFINNYDESISPKQLISNFRRTSTEIEGLNNTTIKQQIEFTGRELNIDEEILKQADEFRKLRNYKLSHAPREDDEIDPSWLKPIENGKTNKAEIICRTFIWSYIVYKDNNRNTTVSEEVKG